MKHQKPAVPSPRTVMWERVGDEVVICDPVSHTLYRLSSDKASTFLDMVGGPTRVDPKGGGEHVSDALSSRPCPTGNTVSRRHFLALTATGAATVSLCLPVAAVASSQDPKPGQEPTLIAEDVTLADWAVDDFGGGFFLLNRADLGQVALGNVFEEGDAWVIDIIDFGDNLQQSRVVALQGGILTLTYAFTGLTSPTAPITARLRNVAKNLISAPFAVAIIT